MDEYLKSAQNTLIRVATVLDGRIGEIYNNESLVVSNQEIKCSSSIRLALDSGYDRGSSFLMFQDKDGGFFPFELELVESLAGIEFAYSQKERYRAIREIINKDGSIHDDEKNALNALFEEARRAASTKFRSSPTRDYERLAYEYQIIMKSNMGYQYLGILARLNLYIGLLGLDERFCGINFEEAMLIRREEYIASLQEDGHERLTRFIAECVLDGATRAADLIESLSEKGEYAALFLSMRMEKGKEYTIDEVAILFGMDPDMMKALILVPALSSDKISVGTSKDGKETLSLID